MRNYKIAFFMLGIAVGGTEKVLLEILAEMKRQCPNWEITVYSRDPVRDVYFIDFFKKHDVKLKDKWRLVKPQNIFLKIGYKIINPFYKLFSYLFFNVKRDIARECFDALISFQAFAFTREIHTLSSPKIAWFHASINHFNENSEHASKHIKIYDKIVCLSDSFKNDFIKQYPDYADKIVRIYNSVNTQIIRNKAKLDNSHGKYFCVVSRLHHHKDNETIIKAFEVFAKTQPEARLLIAGEGPLEEKMKRMAANCPAIEFLGKINEPYALIKNSCGHILSSYNEGFAMVLLENAALETLSIASRCKSGPPEILMDGKAGILFTPGDHEELAEILDNVWNGKIDTETLIKTATENLDRFSAERNTKQIIFLIEKACNV